MRSALFAFVVLSASSLAAQSPPATQTRAERFLRYCEDWNGGGNRARESFCEVRDTRLPAPPATGMLVDGRENGSVAIYGWDRKDVLVRALISAHSDSKSEAQALAKDVRIETEGHRVRSNGPRSTRYDNWSVAFEVWVPKKTNIDAEAHNGGVSIESVEGRMYLRTVNGGVRLRDVAGDVRGEATNGGVAAYLTGTTWRGTGLDLETTNGGVTLDIPRNYGAELETGTVNGGFEIDFPITIQGTIGRRITTKLGAGGPRVRAYTTNGGVRIRSIGTQ